MNTTKNIMVCLVLCSIAATSSCKEPAPHDRVGWKAENFYDDPQVLALCHAIEDKDIPEIERLVKSGVDINAVGKKGMTPLLWAFPMGEPVFKRMLELGADPNLQVTEYLRVAIVGDSVLSMAARRDILCEELFHDINMDNYLKLTLEHGGDPNLVNPDNKNTPLISLTRGLGGNEEERLKQLVDAGCNINYQDPQGHTAASLLVPNRYDLVYELLRAGADYRPRKGSGMDLVSDIAYHEHRTKKKCGENYARLYQTRLRYLAKVIAFLEQEGGKFKAAEDFFADENQSTEYWKLPVDQRPWFPECKGKSAPGEDAR